MPRSKNIGATCPKKRLKPFNLATLKLISSGKVPRALLTALAEREIKHKNLYATKSTIYTTERSIYYFDRTYQRGENQSHKRKYNRCRRRWLQNRTHRAVPSVLLHSTWNSTFYNSTMRWSEILAGAGTRRRVGNTERERKHKLKLKRRADWSRSEGKWLRDGERWGNWRASRSFIPREN